MQEQFIEVIKAEYNFNSPSLGIGLFQDQALREASVNIPLKMLNRHGLIAGATGTGKTKTLQLLSEGLSEAGIPVLLMDIKGDLSGLAKAGEDNPKVRERIAQVALPHEFKACPVELLSLSQEPGLKLRATVLEFGPVLFSKILDLNEVQSDLVNLIFKYCDDQSLPLLDLKDFKRLLKFISDDGKRAIEENYGRVSPASVATILRKVTQLEAQGGEEFFGEPSFDVNDLLRKDSSGHGFVSILRLSDLQDRPKLFSSFMLSLLAEIYREFPEEGDLEKPKLVLFIDEAHLLFTEASDELLKQIESIIKLIRSKGIGIFFCTQNPTDVPEAILSQLGLKVQHALRAFTAKDRKAIQKAAENYPASDFYQLENELTALGIGEAFVTGLNEKGIPTPLVRTLLCAPKSRMGVLSEAEVSDLVSKSVLAQKYNRSLDRESAYEILNAKLKPDTKLSEEKAEGEKPKKETKSDFEKFLNQPIVKQAARTAVSTLTRGLLGMLLGSPSRRRRRN